MDDGRPAYNTVSNETEDQQIPSMIVRRRYDETFGMLAVSGVTAGLRIGASVGANPGVGSSGGYEGNPLFSSQAAIRRVPREVMQTAPSRRSVAADAADARLPSCSVGWREGGSSCPM